MEKFNFFEFLSFINPVFHCKDIGHTLAALAEVTDRPCVSGGVKNRIDFGSCLVVE